MPSNSNSDGDENILRFNAANLPNPPHALRKRHDGRNKDLQKEFFKDKRVLAFYENVIEQILEFFKGIGFLFLHVAF